MRPLLVLAVVTAFGACVGGWYGWRKSAFDDDVPPGVVATAGMLGRDYDRFVKQRRRAKRLGTAALWSFGCAALVFITMVIVAASVGP